MRDVKDVDRGWGALQSAIAEADGLTVRAGILSGVPKYPKKRGKTPIAKVAGVHGVHKLITQIFERSSKERWRRMREAAESVMRGADPEAALLAVGDWMRDSYRDMVYRQGLISDEKDRGRLIESIRSSLFDGKAWIGGDDPKRPKIGDKGPFKR